ncbi:MAG: efflux transporter periplasmic adaptor subunit [Mucilaginibacter sp.]|nr:efflux transporter periplasmic adaptor subunit [Mucilaginibacter sp.]
MNKMKIVALLFVLWFTACKQKPQVLLTATQGKAYYTCSMHPQIHEDHPGNCPICGMKLIKVELTGYNAAATDKITLTPTQIQLAGIQTDTVREENTGSEKTLTGTVTVNESDAEEMSARIAGRIQRLFVRTTGEKISVGQPVYSIYSDDLQEAEKEYLLARQQQKVLHNPDVDYRQLIAAAENKLQLWGLSRGQISALATSGNVSATTIVLSKVNGTVSEIAVHEGDYVTEGMPILKTQGLNSLWIEAQVYAGETSIYKENAPVNVSFPDLGEQRATGKVVFVNPELTGTSKVDLIRISIPNPQGLIKPGMLAYVTIANGNKRALAVPASAVLTDGRGSRVWVKNADGSFSSRTIVAGAGNQTYVPVISGLTAGDVVVSNGAYLLNSEFIFKNGGDKKGMGNMKM